MAATRDPCGIIWRVCPLAREMTLSTHWFGAHHYTCDEAQGFGIHLLHEEADHTLAVLAAAWLPGRGAPPHNHGIWAVVAEANIISINENYDLHETARLPALVNMPMCDGFISGWYWKRVHAFWRPVTAIREADTDGNPDTIQDTAWDSLRPAPALPDYPSTHSVLAGSSAEEAFRQGLRDLSYRVGQDVILEFRTRARLAVVRFDDPHEAAVEFFSVRSVQELVWPVRERCVYTLL